MTNFIKQFKAADRVSTPLVAIRTFDNTSTIETIKRSYEKEQSILIWDCVQGLKALTDSGKKALNEFLKASESNSELTIQLPETLRLLSFTKASQVEDTFVFLHNPHMIWTDPSVIQGIWNLRDLFKASGNMLVLLVSNGAILPAELSNDFLILDESLPTAQDLEKIVKDTFKFANLDKPSKETLDSATAALIGLPAFPAEQAASECLEIKENKSGRSGVLDIVGLWDRKRQVINQTKGLSVYTGSDKFEDVGGVANVKNFLTRIMEGNNAPNTIIFIDEIEKAFAGTGTDTSGVKTEMTGTMLSWMEDKQVVGIMFIGLPGVGKSQLPKTLGNKYGKAFIKFDLSGMQDSLVGNSGANLRNAIAMVDTVSGGKVLAIATCNSIDSLPPELQSRFQLATFFFDAPTEDERASIWGTYRTLYAINPKDELPKAVGWTGREIKGCCEKAYRLNISLKEAAKYVVPCTISNARRVEALRVSSSGKYLSASKEGIYDYKGTVETEVEPSITGRKMKE